MVAGSSARPRSVRGDDPLAHPPVDLSRRQLDELFGAGSSTDIPEGIGTGTALIAAGTPLARPLALLARVLWLGKAFDATHHVLNLLTPAGCRAIRADVYHDRSILDGKPCVVLDYRSTSVVAHWIRDEIRQVAPGEYVGVVYVAGRRIPLRFWLSFGDPHAAHPPAA
jgi:hypothetical protein